MKKKLDGSSISMGNELPNDKQSFYEYLKENGESYFDKNGNWHWYRYPTSQFEYVILDHNYLNSLQSSWINEISKEGPGTENNPISIDTYNSFARADEWHGGYVQNFGYIGIASSSLYGNSIFLGSWYERGALQNPVSQAQFYELVAEKRWRGGYVDTWDYVSPTTKILGSSNSFILTSHGEQTLGAIINLGNCLKRTYSLSSLREEFKNKWDSSRNSFEIDDRTLYEFLRQHFYYSSIYNIVEAIRKHKRILVRIVGRKENKNGETKKYGKDVLVIDYNAIKRTYRCISSMSNSLGDISVKDIENGNIEIISYIFDNE